MRRQLALTAIATLAALAFAVSGCGGDDDDTASPSPAATATGETPAAAGSPTAAPSASGASIALDPDSVATGEVFRVVVSGVPDAVQSGAQQVCVGIIDPAGGDVVKLGQVPAGRAEYLVQGVLPADAAPGAYEVALAPCDFPPGSGLASATLTVE